MSLIFNEPTLHPASILACCSTIFVSSARSSNALELWQGLLRVGLDRTGPLAMATFLDFHSSHATGPGGSSGTSDPSGSSGASEPWGPPGSIVTLLKLSLTNFNTWVGSRDASASEKVDLIHLLVLDAVAIRCRPFWESGWRPFAKMGLQNIQCDQPISIALAHYLCYSSTRAKQKVLQQKLCLSPAPCNFNLRCYFSVIFLL